MKKISIFLLLILTVTIALLFSACTPLHKLWWHSSYNTKKFG